MGSETKAIGLDGKSTEISTSTAQGLLPFSIRHVATGAGYDDLYVQVVSVKDSYQPTFKQEMVYGRMDPIPSYQNTVRKVQVSIKLDKDLHGTRSTDAEQQQRNADVNARDLQTIVNDIIKLMYPVYTSNTRGTNISASPLLRVKLGQFLHNSGRPGLGVLCAPESITIDHAMAGSGVSAADFDIGGALGYAFPGSYVVSLGLLVLHEDAKVGFVYHDGKMRFGQGPNFPWDANSYITSGKAVNPGPSAQVLDMRGMSSKQITQLQKQQQKMLNPTKKSVWHRLGR